MASKRQRYERAASDGPINITSESAQGSASKDPRHHPITHSVDGTPELKCYSDQGALPDVPRPSWRSEYGLGLSMGQTPSPPRSTARPAPVRSNTPRTPQSADPLISRTPSSYLSPQPSFSNESTLQGMLEDGALPRRGARGTPHHLVDRTRDQPSLLAVDDGDEIDSLTQGSMKGEGPVGCPSRKNIYQRKRDWNAITMVSLSVFSTVFSGIYFVIAILAPRYNRIIHSNGALPLSTATFTAAFLAKLIELSFVTVFVWFLGQVLSRRALMKSSRGVSLAELTMRSWILQPGALITHMYSVRLAGFTWLGAIGLMVAVVSTLYTTAADTLVAPKLKLLPAEMVRLNASVLTTYASLEYAKKNCRTPISFQPGGDPDPRNDYMDISGEICLHIQHSGQSFQNYQLYLSSWAELVSKNSDSRDLRSRPSATGLLFNDTRARGSWIDIQNFTETSALFKRRTHNVTMAMPHSGVVGAAEDPGNKILQPVDLEGLGEYRVQASVLSPAVNVVCAGLTERELEPFIYTMWDHGNNSYADALGGSNKSVVDDIFGFGEEHGRKLPTFAVAPIPYNTVLNGTTPRDDGTIYILGQAPSEPRQRANMSHPFELCSIKSFMSPACSTWYHATQSGGILDAHCEDPNDRTQYSRSTVDAPTGYVREAWKDVGNHWGMALGFGGGLTKNNGSNSRVWTKLIPRTEQTHVLDPMLPSSAEALAVLAAGTLLLSSLDSPLTADPKNVSADGTLPAPTAQQFAAMLRSKQYVSGGNRTWQKAFHGVLGIVFVANVFCLVYILVRRGQVTDFSEPQNLFSLSINSPPSQALAGTCGAGPEKDDFAVRWTIKADEGDHVYIQESQNASSSSSFRPPPSLTKPFQGGAGLARLKRLQMDDSPLMRSYAELSEHRTGLL